MDDPFAAAIESSSGDEVPADAPRRGRGRPKGAPQDKAALKAAAAKRRADIRAIEDAKPVRPPRRLEELRRLDWRLVLKPNADKQAPAAELTLAKSKKEVQLVMAEFSEQSSWSVACVASGTGKHMKSLVMPKSTETRSVRASARAWRAGATEEHVTRAGTRWSAARRNAGFMRTGNGSRRDARQETAIPRFFTARDGN